MLKNKKKQQYVLTMQMHKKQQQQWQQTIYGAIKELRHFQKTLTTMQQINSQLMKSGIHFLINCGTYIYINYGKNNCINL